MAQQSTRLKSNRPADYGRVFSNAAIAAVTPLDNISKLPPFGPGRTRMKCITSGSVTVTPEDGVDFTLTMVAGEVEPIDFTIKAFKSVSGGTFEARCYWWYVPQLDEPRAMPTLNP